MTTNQLRFAELRESQKHNRETEAQGRTKLLYDYDVGTRQASAAHRQAGAAEVQAQVAGINAATKQAELDQRKLEYSTSGKAESQAKAQNYASQAGLNTAKTNTEKIETRYRDNILSSQLLSDKSKRAADYANATQNYTKSVYNLTKGIESGVSSVGKIMTMGMLGTN